MLHCRVQLMNSQREEDDDINQKLSKSQQAATLPVTWLRPKVYRDRYDIIHRPSGS